MALIFVSHAFADKALVDEFDETILRNGCGLDSKEIFYSSGDDTGVPDGSDLLAYVRKEVDETGLVVAMLTPTFQTRPVCIAELGAAWARTGKLFPLLVPGMQRSQLDGVLSTQLVEYMDKEPALDRLHDRIREVTGRNVDAATWTRFKKKWLRQLQGIIDAGGVPAPKVVAIEEYEAALRQCDELSAAIASVEDENARLRHERDAIAALKDKKEVAGALLPTDDVERFKELLREARARLRDVDNNLVADAIISTYSHRRGLLVPKDDWGRDAVYELAENGLLVDGDEGVYLPSEVVLKHTDADEAVREAIRAVADDNEDFVNWFTSKYGLRPDMQNYTVLKSVFLDTVPGPW